MRYLKIIVPALVMTCLTWSLSAQTDESFRDFYRQRNQEFKDWRAKANAEFSEYLASAWEEFLLNRGKEDPIGQLPDSPTYYNPEDEKTAFGGLPMGEYASMPMPEMIPAISAVYSMPNQVDVDFFGVHTDIPFPESMRLPRLKAEEKAVSQGWDVLSKSDYMQTVEALQKAKTTYMLSDWALYTAIKKLTDAVYIEEYVNEKILTQMFLLCQLQYKVRVGSCDNELIILLPFQSTIYQVPYVAGEDDDFYVFSYSRLNDNSPIYTFTEDFSAAEKKIDLVVDSQLRLGYDFYQDKSLSKWTSIIGEDVTVPINLPSVKFYLDYPQSDLLTYHKSGVDTELKKAVFKPVRYKILKDEMNEQQAVTFVLNLIQKGFDYKTDYEMFGRGKPLFVEESFYYGSNNCKDRVLIFSWIVKDLLGLDVVLFRYQGHVSCGVHLPADVKGDSFTFEGKRYVMCDPTYIGAPIGATMTKYRGVQPEIVKL